MNKTTTRNAVFAATAAVALVLLSAAPALAASKSWKYTEANCTQTTITGHNSWNGLQFSGSTSRTQDICSPVGVTHQTGIVLVQGSGVASHYTTGTSTGTITLGAEVGARASGHSYGGFSEAIGG
jgi:hypothetical protein